MRVPKGSGHNSAEGEKMKLYIKNLYGIKNDRKAYYRKVGDYCFEFVSKKEGASDLTAEEIVKVMEHSDFYTRMYGANIIGTEE